MAKKIRPLGDIMLDLEPLIFEMVEDHDLQFGDILNLVFGYMKVHCPDAQEEFLDGTHPVFFYGTKEKKDEDD